MNIMDIVQQNNKTFLVLNLTVTCVTIHVANDSILSFLMTFNHMRIRTAPYHENH